MRSTHLFGIFAVSMLGLLCALGGLTLHGLEKSRWWDTRTQLAQESYVLHIKLEANLNRFLFLVGNSPQTGEKDYELDASQIRNAIQNGILEIRNVIAREIRLVGEEEIEELELLEEIENLVKSLEDKVISSTSDTSHFLDGLNRSSFEEKSADELATVLFGHIAKAIGEELEEVEQTIAEAETFRMWLRKAVFYIFALGFVTFVAFLHVFNVQVFKPVSRLQSGVQQLRRANYNSVIQLGGSLEFKNLESVLNDLMLRLESHNVSGEKQKHRLEQTVLKRTKELQELVDKLEAGEENRKQFMTDISHELRTPLAIILGEADVALRGSKFEKDDNIAAFNRIRETVKHASQIVDDMFTVARFEAGQLRLNKKKVDLAKMINDAISMFPGSVNFSEPSSKVIAEIDEVRLRQSVLSLFLNAERYGGPNISIELVELETSYEIAVEDDGSGLSIFEKSRAFERFFRGPGAGEKASQGMGLGLPIVKSIVEAHAGTIELIDGVFGGLKVVLRMPK